MTSDEINVRFKFKDHRKVYRATITRAQFENLQILPSIVLCEIVNDLGEPMEKDVEMKLKKRLAGALKNDTTHVKKLSYD